MLNVTISRDVKIKLSGFTDFFKGFERVDAIRELFGDKTEQVLNELRVEFCNSRRGYMWICDDDGHIVISAYYLKNGEERDIYLDVIHELVHIKQMMDGRELFDEKYIYVERPTEIEAYRITIEEARRIGMNENQIKRYLSVEWIDQEDKLKLIKELGLN